jgi:putative transposase
LRPRRRAAIPSRSRPISRGLVPTGLDQLWVADITYVRLAETFVYLAVVIDAFSRRVVGWALDDHLEARLAVDALDQAIEARDPPPGLIHHSDRGVQYASSEYAARLDERGLQRSMSRPGNPYDNAKAESFMKTLKAEEADGTAYADLEDARGRIGAFIEDVYNADRLHSALGYKSPIAFEAAIRNTADRNQQPLTALSPN